jgi:hypothetical protein
LNIDVDHWLQTTISDQGGPLLYHNDSEELQRSLSRQPTPSKSRKQPTDSTDEATFKTIALSRFDNGRYCSTRFRQSREHVAQSL